MTHHNLPTTVKMFGFYDTGVLTHDDEVQFLSRLRARPDTQPPTLYIQAGIAGRACARYENKLVHASTYFPVALIAGAFADFMCERADSTNRHYWLWKRDLQNWDMELITEAQSGNLDDTERKAFNKIFDAHGTKTRVTIHDFFNGGNVSPDQVATIEMYQAGGTLGKCKAEHKEVFTLFWAKLYPHKAEINPDLLVTFNVYMSLLCPVASLEHHKYSALKQQVSFSSLTSVYYLCNFPD